MTLMGRTFPRRKIMTDHRMVFINGRFVPWGEATVHLLSHSVSRGSAIFEVLSFYEGEEGPSIFRLDEHVSRLMRTAGLLEMRLPLGEKEIEEGVCETVRRNGLRAGFIKIVGYYSGIAYEILPPETQLDLAIFVIPSDGDSHRARGRTGKGFSMGISSWRKLDPGTVPVEAKVAANYLNGMLARLEAKKRGFDYALLLDTGGCLAEGGTESVFLMRKGRLMTPALGNILDSITRRSVLEVAGILGLNPSEEKIPPEGLLDADEIFLSGTLGKVVPIDRVEDRVLVTVPGPVTLRINEYMEEILAGREKRFRHWLFPVR